MAGGLEDWRIILSWKNRSFKMAGGLEDWRIILSWKNRSVNLAGGLEDYSQLEKIGLLK